MTAFSDFPAPADHPLHPAAEQIHAYLRAYAEHFGSRSGSGCVLPSSGWPPDGSWTASTSTA